MDCINSVNENETDKSEFCEEFLKYIFLQNERKKRTDEIAIELANSRAESAKLGKNNKPRINKNRSRQTYEESTTEEYSEIDEQQPINHIKCSNCKVLKVSQEKIQRQQLKEIETLKKQLEATKCKLKSLKEKSSISSTEFTSVYAKRFAKLICSVPKGQSHEELQMAHTIKTMSPEVYKYMQDVWRFQLPHRTTLMCWRKKNNKNGNGVYENLNVSGMSEEDMIYEEESESETLGLDGFHQTKADQINLDKSNAFNFEVMDELNEKLLQRQKSENEELKARLVETKKKLRDLLLEEESRIASDETKSQLLKTELEETKQKLSDLKENSILINHDVVSVHAKRFARLICSWSRKLTSEEMHMTGTIKSLSPEVYRVMQDEWGFYLQHSQASLHCRQKVRNNYEETKKPFQFNNNYFLMIEEEMSQQKNQEEFANESSADEELTEEEVNRLIGN